MIRLFGKYIHVHVYVWHDNREEEIIIIHEVSRQPCYLPICQVENIRAGKQANEKGNALQMMREILQISFIVPSTLILHWLWTLYILKVGGVHWLVTNQKSWILYWIQMNILHFHVNVLYCKSNFLISIQYIKHRWKNGAHMPRKTIKILCNNLIVRRGDMCPLMREERINVYDMDLSYVLEAQQFNWFY